MPPKDNRPSAAIFDSMRTLPPAHPAVTTLQLQVRLGESARGLTGDDGEFP